MQPRRWLLFCEGSSDARRGQALIDALITLHGTDWVQEFIKSDPNSVREWHSDSPAASPGWIDLHQHRKILGELAIRPTNGKFNGKPAQADALMLSNVFRITRALAKRAVAQASEPITAVVVLRDLDADPVARREGAAQAMGASELPEGIESVVGLASPELEAWILAGFEPVTEDETTALKAQRRDLGFWPHQEAHRLGAGRDEKRKSAKRVVEALSIDRDRETACLRIDSLARRALLATRGVESGLAAWLDRVEDVLVVQVDPGARSRITQRRGG